MSFFKWQLIFHTFRKCRNLVSVCVWGCKEGAWGWECLAEKECSWTCVNLNNGWLVVGAAIGRWRLIESPDYPGLPVSINYLSWGEPSTLSVEYLRRLSLEHSYFEFIITLLYIPFAKRCKIEHWTSVPRNDRRRSGRTVSNQ